LRSMFNTNGKGLEIGPSYNPLVPKHEGFDVEVIDHLSTEDLRKKYSKEALVNSSLIEEVDYVWDGRPLSKIIGKTNAYDYVVASHVIEHTPDMLGFLKECSSLLKQDGVLVLAVPDKRRCFDVFRPLSTTGSVLQAHVEKRKVHPPSVAFDHVAYFTELDGAGGWPEGKKGNLTMPHMLNFAAKVFDRSSNSNVYYDFHAWNFCPSSFRQIIQDLNSLNMLDLKEKAFQLTPGIEFFVTMSQSGSGCPHSRLDLMIKAKRELLEFPLDFGN